jgi:hypothetical protein
MFGSGRVKGSPIPGLAVSGGQALGVGAGKGQQSIDDRGLAPPPVIYGEPLPLFDSNRGADHWQGTSMGSGDGQLCESPIALWAGAIAECW